MQSNFGVLFFSKHEIRRYEQIGTESFYIKNNANIFTHN